MGFAVAASAGTVWIAAPRRFDSGEVAASWSNVGKSRIARKSVGPNQSITAWTRLDWPRLPPTPPSRSTLTLPIVAVETPPEVPTKAARCPPADEPHAAKRSGSRPYCAAFARSQRIAPRQSWICAGQIAVPLRR